MNDLIQLGGHTPRSRHTPGPWHLSENNGFVYEKGGAMVTGTLYNKGGYIVVALSPTGKPEQEKANGHLISAAPELLAALKIAKAEIEQWHESASSCTDNPPTQGCQTCKQVLPDIEAAIAKAEGK